MQGVTEQTQDVVRMRGCEGKEDYKDAIDIAARELSHARTWQIAATPLFIQW